MYNVTLTQDQRIKLELYIRRTGQMRKEEQEACERLGSKLDPSGALVYPSMAAYAEWWAEAEIVLQAVLVALGQAEDATMTNGDMIREMDNEELADTIMCPNESGLDGIECDHGDDKNCSACCLAWLESGYTGNGYGDVIREEEAR